ncbi:MAG: NAD(P)-dependent oxidoreductase [Dongiaceae bacterium]
MAYERIAVTGGNGALGNAIVRDLMTDHEVTSLDITPGRPGVRSRYVDVLSLDALKSALERQDAVVHVAALLQPHDPREKMFQVNTLGTWNVLEAARDLGIRKIVMMSSECASGVISLWRSSPPCPDYLPIDEAHPLRPREPYGVSKQVGEITAQSYARDGGIQIVALRPTLIIMPGMTSYIERVRAIDDPDLWSYVELADVVRAARLALGYQGPPFDVFYLSARDTFSPEETLTFMRRKFGRLPELRQPGLYADNPYAAIWDLRRSETLLGLEPQSDWRRVLAEGAPRRAGEARP